MSLCRIVKLDLVIISGHTARKLKTRNGCCRDCQRVNRLMIVIILLMKVLPTGILYGAHGHMRIKLSIPLAVMKGDIWYHLFPGGNGAPETTTGLQPLQEAIITVVKCLLWII